MHDLQHGQLKVFVIQGSSFCKILTWDGYDLRAFVGAAKNKDLRAEFRDL